MEIERAETRWMSDSYYERIMIRTSKKLLQLSMQVTHVRQLQLHLLDESKILSFEYPG